MYIYTIHRCIQRPHALRSLSRLTPLCWPFCSLITWCRRHLRGSYGVLAAPGSSFAYASAVAPVHRSGRRPADLAASIHAYVTVHAGIQSLRRVSPYHPRARCYAPAESSEDDSTSDQAKTVILVYWFALRRCTQLKQSGWTS